uniref:Prefoldin subunit 2 n=1 Tax=Ciona savignyi TaxID=51511 RepID=H2YRD1_CIOSA
MSDKKLSKEEIVDGFNKLRQEQKSLAIKITQMESERGEHGLVIEALEAVDKDRKCFRLVGGVLVERTVAEVLPALTKNKEQISNFIELMNKQLVEKGNSLNEYRVKHGITVRGENSINENNKPEEAPTTNQTTGVLVSN